MERFPRTSPRHQASPFDVQKYCLNLPQRTLERSPGVTNGAGLITPGIPPQTWSGQPDAHSVENQAYGVLPSASRCRDNCGEASRCRDNSWDTTSRCTDSWSADDPWLSHTHRPDHTRILTSSPRSHSSSRNVSSPPPLYPGNNAPRGGYIPSYPPVYSATDTQQQWPDVTSYHGDPSYPMSSPQHSVITQDPSPHYHIAGYHSRYSPHADLVRTTADVVPETPSEVAEVTRAPPDVTTPAQYGLTMTPEHHFSYHHDSSGIVSDTSSNSDHRSPEHAASTTVTVRPFCYPSPHHTPHTLTVVHHPPPPAPPDPHTHTATGTKTLKQRFQTWKKRHKKGGTSAPKPKGSVARHSVAEIRWVEGLWRRYVQEKVWPPLWGITKSNYVPTN